MHKYLSRAVITPEGIKNFHKQKPTAHRTLEDTAGIDADLTIRIGAAGPIAHQSADFGKIPHRICGGEPVERRQLGYLDTPADEERRGRNEQRIKPFAHDVFERGIDLTTGIGFEDLDMQPESAGSR